MKEDRFPLVEVGVRYSPDPYFEKYGYNKFTYNWKYLDPDEDLDDIRGEKIIYVRGEITNFLRLINNWNRKSEGYIYWTEDV